MKQFLLNHLKNIPGWHTHRKLVIFSVDDYGNVRLDSKAAREHMDGAGLKAYSRFDVYDTLESREDLEQLYDVLSSVKDQNGHTAVFTPFALPCNLDFESVAKEGYQGYRYELLQRTYQKLSISQPEAYEGAWALWQEGIAKGLMAPQFHGREHLNIPLFEDKLINRDSELMLALDNRSLACIDDASYAPMTWTAAFSFREEADTKDFPTIMKDGVKRFEEVFGYAPTVFTPPAQQFPEEMEGMLPNLGLRYYDKPFFRRRNLGGGRSRREVDVMGPQRGGGAVLVRNVVFEPTDPRGFDWVAYSIKQIEAAFFWNKPAIISSHRVNFCGHIDADNRKKGLDALKRLLQAIVKKWPEVEFISAAELGAMISSPADHAD